MQSTFTRAGTINVVVRNCDSGILNMTQVPARVLKMKYNRQFRFKPEMET